MLVKRKKNEKRMKLLVYMCVGGGITNDVLSPRYDMKCLTTNLAHTHYKIEEVLPPLR